MNRIYEVSFLGVVRGFATENVESAEFFRFAKVRRTLLIWSSLLN